MEKPLVSFIIPYYNLPIQMLCDCIDSILALSLAKDEREIIIIDDGSKVSPMNALMKYGDDIVYPSRHGNRIRYKIYRYQKVYNRNQRTYPDVQFVFSRILHNECKGTTKNAYVQILRQKTASLLRM